jgi:predicted house-cleaning NTP pyrophosphatase (Maf/HAM1 superfamily)
LLLLDEPFAGLGSAEIETISALIRQLHAEKNLTILLIEHKLREFMQLVSRVVASQVHFRPLSAAEIAWYVGTGEGADKAGGYALQGRAGAFITSIVGSPSNVIGLPLTDTVELLRAVGLHLPMDLP